MHRIKDRDFVVKDFASPRGGNPSHDIGAVLYATAGVEGTGFSGDTLNYEPGVLINKNGHNLLLGREGDDLLGRVVQVGSGNNGQAGFGQHLAPLLDIGALEADNERDF